MELVVFIALALLIFIVVYFLLKQQRESHQQVLNQVKELREGLYQEIQKTTSSLDGHLNRTSTAMANVNQSLGRLSEATRHIQNLGESMSTLQEILQAPQLKGGFGEYLLEKLLADVLPAGSYKIKHKFRSGEIVDAALKLKDRLVPVDAKFPLDNFRRLLEAKEGDKGSYLKAFHRDVKIHTDDIADKYIRPDEGTYNFAFMYIPAEHIYYELVTKNAGSGGKSILTYASEKHVIPVSPSTFHAYLQAIVYGLRGLKIQEIAEKVLERLTRLRKDFEKFTEDFEVLGGHISRTESKYREASQKLEHFDGKLSTVEEMSASKLPEGKEALPSSEETKP